MIPSEILPRDADVVLFLREMVRRKERNFEAAEAAIASSSTADRIDALPQFLEVEADVFKSRVEELVDLDKKVSLQSILDTLIASEAEEQFAIQELEKKLKGLIQQGKVTLKLYPSKTLKRCISILGHDLTDDKKQ